MSTRIHAAYHCPCLLLQVSLTLRGQQEATIMGQKLRSLLESRDGPDFKVFLMTSPYCRTLQTTDCLLRSFTDEQVGALTLPDARMTLYIGSSCDTPCSSNAAQMCAPVHMSHLPWLCT